jgi:hypothetical protein
MKKKICLLLLLSGMMVAQAQTVQDLFNSGNTKITYLGIDFSHVKLIGNFTEFLEAGDKNVMEIRDIYFPRWNMVVMNEREKFDIAGMLRKSDVYYDIEMINFVNSQTNLENLQGYNTVKFSEEDISSFISTYNIEGKEGIGVLFIAESLNKSSEEAVFHFVALNMANKEILFHRRLKGIPNGFGLRNYWVNSLYRIINDVKFYYYNEWKLKTEPQGEQI